MLQLLDKPRILHTFLYCRRVKAEDIETTVSLLSPSWATDNPAIRQSATSSASSVIVFLKKLINLDDAVSQSEYFNS